MMMVSVCGVCDGSWELFLLLISLRCRCVQGNPIKTHHCTAYLRLPTLCAPLWRPIRLRQKVLLQEVEGIEPLARI